MNIQTELSWREKEALMGAGLNHEDVNLVEKLLPELPKIISVLEKLSQQDSEKLTALRDVMIGKNPPSLTPEERMEKMRREGWNGCY